MEPDPPSFELFQALFLAVPTIGILLGILGVLLLLICSALISGSEIAFFSLTANDVEILNADNSSRDKTIIALKDRPRYLLATILISNNFINIAIIVLSNFVLSNLLPDAQFDEWATNMLLAGTWLTNWFTADAMGQLIKFLLLTVGVTFLLVLFGEVAPKVYAKINNIQLARLMAIPINVLMNLFNPLSALLVNMTQIIENRLASTTSGSNQPSREEIDEAIEMTVSKEEDTEQEVDILKGIVKFGDVSVTQIMCSRVDVVAVDFQLSFSELLKIVRESGYSRIPVYNDDFDNVTGILYAKDLLGCLDEDANFEWQKLIRTNVLYVPEAKKIDDLLKEFQRKRMHMAIVVDEYGGSSGIVTLEDILEEIIGDIQDEFDDEPEVVFQKIDDSKYLFEGKTLLNDVCRIIGLDTSTFDEVRGESDSLAGLLLELLGGLPQKETEINYNDFRFKAVSVNKRRIEQILVTLPDTLKYSEKH